MKKKDIILLAAALLFALAMPAVMNAADGAAGSRIRITVDGEEYGVYPLDENREIEVDTGDFCNKIRIYGGEAYMEEADCPDGYCVRQGKIKGMKQTIVCLPHKLVVEVTGAGEDGQSGEEDIPDGVVAQHCINLEKEKQI